MQLKLKKLEAVESGATWDSLSIVKKYLTIKMDDLILFNDW